MLGELQFLMFTSASPLRGGDFCSDGWSASACTRRSLGLCPGERARRQSSQSLGIPRGRRESGASGEGVVLGTLTDNRFSLEFGSPSGTYTLLVRWEMEANWSREAWFAH